MGGTVLLGAFSLHGIAAWGAARLALSTRRASWSALALAIGLLLVWRSLAAYEVVAHERSIDLQAELLCACVSLLAIVGIAGARRRESSVRRGDSGVLAASECAPDAIVQFGRDGRIAYANPAVGAIFGRPASAVVGRHLSLLLPDPTPAFEAAPTAQRMVRLAGVHADGSRIDLEATLGEHSDRGELRWTAVLRDVTERERVESDLRRTAERYALAAARANDGLWDWDLDRGDVLYSPRFAQMLGLSREVLGTELDGWLERVHPEDLPRFRARLLEHVGGTTPYFECEYRVQQGNTGPRWMLARGLALRDADGRATRVAGSQTDVTQQKRTEERLSHGALHDALTGLPNRALLSDRLSRGLARARARAQKLAVLAVDLDRMNLVNDSFGHAGGDELLIEVARRLHVHARPGDTVARVDGDEFVVVLEDLRTWDEAERFSEQLLGALGQRMRIRDQELVVTASIGIATNRRRDVHPDELVRGAEAAMYRAKALGRARHELCSDAGPGGGLERLALEADLHRALERGEIHVAYQPIVSLRTGRIGGFEALARWRHPERGEVPPAEFVPIAEETGVLSEIEHWMLRETARQLGCWQRQLPLEPALTLAVNVSPRRFADPTLPDVIAEVLARNAIAAGTLELEITERVLLDHDADLDRRLRLLRELGVRLVIDDFGTGYSSLSYLHRLPLDTLKIDQAFIREMGVAPDRAEVVRTIIALSRHLGLDAVAEGVETGEQLQRLREFGCEWAQGFFFAEPVAPDQAAALVRREIDVLDA